MTRPDSDGKERSQTSRMRQRVEVKRLKRAEMGKGNRNRDLAGLSTGHRMYTVQAREM